MEPVKFEEHIKKQFQKREIKPSEGSWEKLQERLEHQEMPSGSNFRWVAAIAAVAVIFFVLGTLFNSPVRTSPEVVDSPEPKVPEKIILEKPREVAPEIKNETAVVTEIENKAEPKKENPIKLDPVPATAERMASVTKLKTAESETLVPPKEEEITELAETAAAYSIDSEVDALLLAANAEIEKDPAYEVQTVSAGKLLNEVEHELEMNFRQKVFEVLKDGYSKAKTAVANRN